MKFTVERDRLADALTWAARTLPARPHQPVLSGLLLEATAEGPSGGKLSIASFDLEVSSRVSIPADVDEPGSMLVNGRLLSEIAKSLPGLPVMVADEGSRLSLRCGTSSFRMPTLPLEEYPSLPPIPESSGSLPGQSFAEAMKQVSVAAAREDALPQLTGVRVEVDGDRMVLAATDRYRLAVRELAWTPGSPQFTASALVPAKTLADAAKSLDSAESVFLAFSSGDTGQGVLGIEGLSRRTTTRLLNGEFPSYRKLLPATHETLAWVETAALIEATKRVALVVENRTAVKLTFSDSEVTLRAGQSEDGSATASDQLDCVRQGPDIEIAFNPQYLLDGLAAVSSRYTRFAFTLSGKPAVLTPAEEPEAEVDDSFLYLLMPVRMSS